MTLTPSTYKLQRTTRRPDWRAYQRRLRRRAPRPWRRRPWVWLAGGAALVVMGLTVARHLPPPAAKPLVHATAAAPPARAADANLLAKTDVQLLLAGLSTAQLLQTPCRVRFGERWLDVASSINAELQNYLEKQVDRRTSRYVAVVVLEARTGRVLALMGYNKEAPEDNPCLLNNFPAASLFKIVTAAGAVEKCGFSGDSPLSFNGARHTLYKSQLQDTQNRYTRHTTLAESFAQSVNPVFGRIGSQCLGREGLRHYAEAFGFNQVLPFEMRVPASHTTLSDDPYQWAEIASGFNQQTVISPVHAALLAAVPPADGLLVEPTVIDHVTDPAGRELYRAPIARSRRAVTPATARTLSRMMQKTVTRGTARKAFRGYEKDPILTRLRIGGKTGSIDNREHDARYDWFVGFADGPQPDDAIAVAALVAHENYIGRRAAEYARLAMRAYFKPLLETTQTSSATGLPSKSPQGVLQAASREVPQGTPSHKIAVR